MAAEVSEVFSNIVLIISSIIGIIGSLSISIYTFNDKIPIHDLISRAGVPGRVISIVLFIARLFVIPMMVTLTIYVIKKMNW